MLMQNETKWMLLYMLCLTSALLCYLPKNVYAKETAIAPIHMNKIQESIKKLYKQHLHREADNEGMSNFVQAIVAGKINIEEAEQIILNSPEHTNLVLNRQKDKKIKFKKYLVLSVSIFLAVIVSFFSRKHIFALLKYAYKDIRLNIVEARLIISWFKFNVITQNDALWLTSLTAIGIAVRAFFLASPMRYDESFTFLNFVNKGVPDLFYYPLPNNHVLHTLLVRLSVELFGKHPVAIRIPSFIAGICIIPMIFALSRILTKNKTCGYIASAAVTVCPYLILYDTMARGYSLLSLLCLTLAILVIRACERPQLVVYFLISLNISLGLLIMPSFLFPAAGLFAWMLIMQWLNKRKLTWIISHNVFPCVSMTLLLTLLFYLETSIVSGGYQVLYNNRFTKSIPWSAFLGNIRPHIINCATSFTRDVPAPIIIGGLLCLVIGEGISLKRKEWHVFFLLPTLFAASTVILFFKRAIPFERTWIFFIPLTFIIIDYGASCIVKKTNKYVKSAILLIIASSAILTMNHRIIDKYNDTGRFPEAPFIVRALSSELCPQDQVIANVPANEPIRFYMWYYNMPKNSTNTEQHRPAKTFYIVKKDAYNIEDLTKQKTRAVLSIMNAEIHSSIN